MDPVVSAMREIILSGKMPDFKSACPAAELAELQPAITIAETQLSHLKYMRHCWGRSLPMQIGIHTWYVCHEIDKAFEKFRNGISTNLIVLIPFRQGKSEITTRFLPPHFLGEYPDREVIVTSHSTKNTAKFSRFGRSLIRSKKYQELYPNIDISTENAGVEEWGIKDHEGLAQYFGILAGSQGMGASCLITDDFFGGREDAESAPVREKVDESYRENIFTRRADPAINLITVTPWHPEDLVGRIQKRMNSGDKSTGYKIIRMPYKEPDEQTLKDIADALETESDEELKKEMLSELERYGNGGYLFSKMFSDQWYLDMETSLGGPNGYGTASLMRCTPTMKTGRRFKTEKIQILKEEEFNEKTRGLVFNRAYDLASSVKQVNKTDPDYTVGVKAATRFISTSIQGLNHAEIYVADVIRGRWESPVRNQKIIDTAITDGLIKILVETFGQYKDACDELKSTLRGIRIVKGVRCPGDKLIKSECLETIINSGKMYLLEGSWNAKYIAEFNEDTGYDDQIDATVISYRSSSPVRTGFMYDEQLVV